MAFQLPIFDRWFSHMDEGHVLLFSDLIANGGDLYRDATLYPLPGAFYLLAQFYKLFGPSILLSRWTWWMLPVLMFGAIALSVLILRAGGPDLPFVLLGAVLVLALAWILISSLNPARADRTCPECGEEALERLDPETTRGVTCARCGHTDRDASSWFFAEEETNLEEIVLAERARVSGLEPEELAHAEEITQNTEAN